MAVKSDIPRKDTFPPFSSRILKSLWYTSTGSAVWVAADRVHIHPLIVPFGVRVDRIGHVNHNPVSGNCYKGIYRDNGDTPVGGELIVQTGSVAVGLVNQVSEDAITEVYLEPGVYWIAMIVDNNTHQVRIPGYRMVQGGTLTGHKYDRAGGVYGPLTDPCPATTVQTAIPQFTLRVSDVVM